MNQYDHTASRIHRLDSIIDAYYSTKHWTDTGPNADCTANPRAEFLRARCWTNKWHLLFPKKFQQIEFGFVAWLHHLVVLLESAFPQTRFEASWTIANLVNRDHIHELLVQPQPIGTISIAW